MTLTPSPTSDLELVDLARSGDSEAVVELWRRYYPKALSVARGVSRQPRDAEEIAADAFAGMLAALDGGAGPVGSVPAYLATSVRNLATSRARRPSSRELATDAIDDYAAARQDLSQDPVAKHAELGLVREAYATLPRRWQEVLWRTAVDEDSNIEIARELGLTPNGVAALARRARRGLRKAYLRAHVSTRGVDPQCEPYLDQLADLATDGRTRAGSHVATCLRCGERMAELRVVDRQMRSVLGPAILGLAPAAWTGVGTGAATGAGLSAGAGVAATAAPHLAWWGAATGVVAVAGLGVYVAQRDAPPPFVHSPPPVVATTTAPPPSTPSSPPTPTRTPPATTPTALPTRIASPTPAPAPPARPTRATPSATTTTSARTPLAIGLDLDGDLSDTAATVTASVQGTSGGLTMTVSLPPDVSFISAQGDWAGCTQNGSTLNCTAGPKSSGRWSGTIHTHWPAGTRGRLSSTVAGRYLDGTAVTATTGTTWPP